MYKQKEINTALRLYDQLKSIRGTIRVLGYPSRNLLTCWIRQRNKTGKATAKRGKRRIRNVELKKKAIRNYIRNGKRVGKKICV